MTIQPTNKEGFTDLDPHKSYLGTIDPPPTNVQFPVLDLPEDEVEAMNVFVEAFRKTESCRQLLYSESLNGQTIINQTTNKEGFTDLDPHKSYLGTIDPPDAESQSFGLDLPKEDMEAVNMLKEAVEKLRAVVKSWEHKSNRENQ
jgi:hypothetical protein